MKELQVKEEDDSRERKGEEIEGGFKEKEKRKKSSERIMNI